jgi:hypothetical protein
MPESHSKGEQRHYRTASVTTDDRSLLTRVSAGRPFKPYVYNGGDLEPAAVTAARERHRALTAEMERARDEAAQRQRERSEALTAERDGTFAVGPGTGWWDAPDRDELAELTAERDRYHAAMAAAVPGPRAPGPAPAPPPVTAASRCGGCGYLTTAAGHRVMCDD